jgi:V8-like Glu-specific endopeptidase
VAQAATFSGTDKRALVNDKRGKEFKAVPQIAISANFDSGFNLQIL